MSDFAITQPAPAPAEITSTRIDQAHDLPASDASGDPTPWLALAGRDSSKTTEQLDRQTNELLAYVQRQNQEIDSRQAELNARLAQLDSELRAARLHAMLRTGDDAFAADTESDTGPDRIAREEPAPESIPEPSDRAQLDPAVRASAGREQGEEPSEPVVLDARANLRHGDFDDVEELVAEIKSVCGQPKKGPAGAAEDPATPIESMTTDTALGSEDAFELESTDLFSLADSLPFSCLSGQGRGPGIGRLGSPAGPGSMTSAFEAADLESERRLLAERKIELDRRKLVLQRMQDETQALHREALEMRLVTEQLWAELSGTTPAEHLQQLLSTLRARLDDHYATMNQTLSERKEELVALRRRMQQKQQELREQSGKLQQWVESRHEEIKSHAAQLDAREMLLNRREHRLQDEFSKWEAQQGEYREQLNALLRKISLAGLRS